MKYLIYFLFLLNITTIQAQTIPYAFEKEILKQFPTVRDFTISLFEEEAYFTAQTPNRDISVIMKIKKQDGKWSKPEMASFSGRYSDLEPFLSPDELRLYFASNRPIADTTENSKDYDIWYVERTDRDAAWSEPINMGSPVNSEHDEFYPSVAANNNLYFTSVLPASKGLDDVFLCEWQEDKYAEPVSIEINTEGYEFNAFIAPDESFMVFSGYGRPDGFGGGDLYISKRNEDGTWGKPSNLGEYINSNQLDYSPFVNTKTNTLYFTSRKSNITIPSSGFKNTEQLLTEMNLYENGTSRIYFIPFGIIKE